MERQYRYKSKFSSFRVAAHENFICHQATAKFRVKSSFSLFCQPTMESILLLASNRAILGVGYLMVSEKLMNSTKYIPESLLIL